MKNLSKEDYFIKQFSKSSSHIGDDGALVGNLVYSTDSFFENVHFKKEWMSLKQIARKAMLVNISDAIAMNARPKYALLNIAIPKSYSLKDIKKLSKGFLEIAKEYSIEIIGGDTISNEKLDISITIISETKNAILRSNAKLDDLVCFTGELGTCKKDLESLFKNKKISKNSKFIEPKLKPEFFYEVSKYINSSMDISDGLFFELEKISKQSRVGFEFFKKYKRSVGCSGEEYEILFTFNKKQQKKIEKIAKKHKVKLNIFAKVTKGKYRCDCRNHHF